MGGSVSTEDRWEENSSSSRRSTSYPFDSRYEYAQPPLYHVESVSDRPPQYAQNPLYRQESGSDPPPQMAYPPLQMAYPPPQEYGYGGGQPRNKRRRLDKRYSVEEVTEALARAGLESSSLIVGIDFTKSNEWTGAKSFNKRSLHDISNGLNPYEQAISIIGRLSISQPSVPPYPRDSQPTATAPFALSAANSLNFSIVRHPSRRRRHGV